MPFLRLLVPAALALALAGCAAWNSERHFSADSGAWLPLKDGADALDEKARLLRRHGAPARDGVFEGLVVWKDSALVAVPSVAFAWSGGALTLWYQKDDSFDLVVSRIELNRCAGLERELEKLLAALGQSALKMTDPGLELADMLGGHPPTYEAKYFPAIGGSIRLRNLQWDPVPWPRQAERVMETGLGCGER